jgi:SAM-dependent methyltransferase
VNETASLTASVARTTSYEFAVDVFDTADSAGWYPSGYNRTFRQRRERACLIELIRQIPAGSAVLDLPCGTGRVTRLVAAAGFDVTGADSSPHMVNTARANLEAEFPRARFAVREALATGFADKHFDAVISNRLFHHFNEPATRVAVLREFARISRGPVIVSFACSFSLDVVVHRLKRRLQGRPMHHYRPIPLRRFCEEFREAGLSVTSTRAVLWGLSRMWYVTGVPCSA